MLSNRLLSASRHKSVNDGRSGGVNRLRSLRRMNACIRCRLVGLAKPHHAGAVHQLGVTVVYWYIIIYTVSGNKVNP